MKRLNEYERRIYKIMREEYKFRPKYALDIIRRGRKYFDSNEKVIL